jgi:hypothetical protein
MREAGAVVNKSGEVIYWHVPNDRGIGALPDSRDLWDIIWENRVDIAGFAHTHPGSGTPQPSHTDLTTFAAIEAALGKRLVWWIFTSDMVSTIVWLGPEKLGYKGAAQRSNLGFDWVDRLRELSEIRTVAK